MLAFLSPVATSTGPGTTAPADKLQPALLASFATSPTRDFWVRFDQRADLSAAPGIANWDDRGRYVYQRLQSTARAAQGPARALLDSERVDYTAYTISNAIYVPGGTRDLALRLAGLGAVAEVRAPTRYALVEPVRRAAAGTGTASPDGVEWGVANIHADQVWAQFGVRGEGITVASIDTGVQFDHPALVRQYRGNNGDGTFDHNYNWFDAAGTCQGAPCDNNGHGTHTMGTMVGDDGAGNQVGVAPAAKWIEANGCCPTDKALVDSGEWMLAPRDLAGDNPDPSKRPHIINNSWGSQVPTNDPFMEDVIAAWQAAGIFAVFSNGNSGPGCQTSGSPGSRTLTYSVGAYDQNNTIASFSGRGTGQDATVKPNISAPGVAVRSSVPNNQYATFDGTSMAAPHVAGAVALLWSAAPALIGDIPGTRELLDETAVDTPDPECGGTASDNNVYGQGRLDALALLEAAPIGDTGRLAGTVTDAQTGQPVGGATVTITGPITRHLSTGTDGSFSVLLPVGGYTVTVAKFRYVDATRSATVTHATTTTLDFALAAVPMVTVSGRVTDGSGHGWPLYAKVSVADTPIDPVYTDPATGRYSIAVPAGQSFSIEVEAQTPGYLPSQSTVDTSSDRVLDAALKVDPASCSAAGYRYRTGARANFDDMRLPAGWSVADQQNQGQVWRFNDPLDRTNRTGGSGGFAIADYFADGSTGSRDNSLVSPVMDLSTVADPAISYRTDYFSQPSDTVVDVELSLDAGATWTSLQHFSGDANGPQSVPIPQAAGQPEVRVRWHYATATFGTWWQVDDVQIGAPQCVPAAGGLVVGNVLDQNTGAGVNAATVRGGDGTGEVATTTATPGDPALPDGFFSLFSPATGGPAAEVLSAGKTGYTSGQTQVQVTPDAVTAAQLRLPAGRLTIQPSTVDATVQLGQASSRTFTVTNTGSAPASFALSEQSGGFSLLGTGAPLREIPGDFRPGAGPPAGGSPVAASTPQQAPWTDVASYPTKIMDNSADVLDGRVYSVGGFDGVRITGAGYFYDPGTGDWSRIADLPEARQNAAAGAIGGRLYAAGGWSATGLPSPSTFDYDPATDTWTQLADAPVAVAAAGKAVLGDQLYLVGGCADSACFQTSTAVVRYDPGSNRWRRLADYPEPAGHLGCGAIAGKLYCTGGIDNFSAVRTSTYAYDPATDTWTPKASLPIPNWAFASSAANGQLIVSGGVTLGEGGFVQHNMGFRYDPATDAWTQLPNANHVSYRAAGACGFYKIGGAIAGSATQSDVELLPGFDACGEVPDVPWFSIGSGSATLQPGQSVTVTTTVDGRVDQPGTYLAGIAVAEDTPYILQPIGVTMTVTPPKTWGKVAGVVTAVGCDGARTALSDATVQIDWSGGRHLLMTGPDGGYGWWADKRTGKLTVAVAKDGYQPQVTEVRIRAGGTVPVDFDLLPREC
ncbi:MAG: S8 family serine peptidase [Micromonosporaceae bacterium]|nr:S8 family serine peptidase [Micromonosporaceae bacterium]